MKKLIIIVLMIVLAALMILVGCGLTHNLTLTVNGSGTTNPAAGVHSLDAGTSVNITATPESGWKFDGWTGEVAASMSASTTITMNSDKTVVANFSKITHNLTLGINGSGSTNPAAGLHSFDAGTVVNIAATPSPSGVSIFNNWTGDVAAPISASTTVTMNSDKTVVANFSKISYDLTIGVSGSGTTLAAIANAFPGDGVHAGPGVYAFDAGRVINLTATPAIGFKFDGWTGDVATPSSASTAITMYSSKTVVAKFSKITYNLTLTINGSGSTNPAAGVQNCDAGTMVNLTATPSSGWQFDGWSGDVGAPISASSKVTMNSDKTVVANFSITPIPPTISISVPTNVNPGSSLNITGTAKDDIDVAQILLFDADGKQLDSFDCTGVQTEITHVFKQTAPASYSTTYSFQVQAIDNDGQKSPLVKGSGTTLLGIDGGGPHGSSPSTYYLTIGVNGGGTIIWEAGGGAASSPLLKTISGTTYLAANAYAFDIVGGNTGPGVYAFGFGAVVGLMATPDSGWKFDSWTGDVASSTSAATTVTMYSDKTVVANFVAQPPEITEVLPNSGGQGWTLAVITGTNFTGTTAVSFGENITVNSFVANSDVQITANISISASATNGVRDISVTNAIGTGILVNSFTINNHSICVTLPASTFNQTNSMTETRAAIPSLNNWKATFNNTVQWASPTNNPSPRVALGFYSSLAQPGDPSIQLIEYSNGFLDIVKHDSASPGGQKLTTIRWANPVTISLISDNLTVSSPVGSYISSFPSFPLAYFTGGSTQSDISSGGQVYAQVEGAYNLTLGVNGSGTTSPAAGIYSFGAGTVVNLMATPASGFKFDGWTGEVAAPMSVSTNVTMNSDKTVVANFVPQPPEITGVFPNSGGNGWKLAVITGTNFTGTTAVSFGKDITVNSFVVNSDVQITANISISASATTGVRDISVTSGLGTDILVNGFTVNNNSTYVTLPASTFTQATSITKQITAISSLNNWKVTYNNAVQWESITNNPRVGLGFFSSLASPGDPSIQLIEYNNGLLDVVKHDSANPGGQKLTTIQWANPVTISLISGNLTVSSPAGSYVASFPSFPLCYFTGGSTQSDTSSGGEVYAQVNGGYNLTIEVNGSGTTSPAAGVYSFDAGTVVNLTAMPSTSVVSFFNNWTGEVAAPMSVSTNVTMNSDKTVVANFSNNNWHVFTTGNWTNTEEVYKDPGNPPFPEGYPTGYPTVPGTVLKIGSTYAMYYHRNYNDGTNEAGEIFIATSSNPTSGWTAFSKIPVLTAGSPGKWDDKWVTMANVVLDNGTYYMFYEGSNSTDSNIGYATSTDGYSWTKQTIDHPLLEHGSPGWDGTHVGTPFVIKMGTIYYMYYHGNGDEIYTDRIGYATASSITGPYTKYSNNPTFIPSSSGWDSNWVGQRAIFYYQGTWVMMYEGNKSPGVYNDQTGIGTQTGIATSSTLDSNWSRYENNPVFALAGGNDKTFNNPVVFNEGSKYYVYMSSLPYNGVVLRFLDTVP